MNGGQYERLPKGSGQVFWLSCRVLFGGGELHAAATGRADGHSASWSLKGHNDRHLPEKRVVRRYHLAAIVARAGKSASRRTREGGVDRVLWMIQAHKGRLRYRNPRLLRIQ